MNTSNLISVIVLIFMLAVSKAYPQDPGINLSEVFGDEFAGYEYDGMETDMLGDIPFIHLNYDDEEGNRIKFTITNQRLGFGVDGLDFEKLNVLMEGKILHGETFKIQGKTVAAMICKTGEGMVEWSIGPFEMPNTKVKAFCTIRGEGRKITLMKQYRALLSKLKKKAAEEEENEK